MRVLIAVTHLLGTGHLARALTLGRAFAAAGHRVVLASGGMPVAHLDAMDVEVVQLPPLRSDGTDFARLLGGDGVVADAGYLALRREMLCGLVRAHDPQVVITELFPFGRRALSEEFLALLETARGRVVLGSVRDILAPPKKASRAEQTEATVLAHYDAVLVHSDPGVVPLDLSWPVTEALRARLRYTGFVVPPVPEGVPNGEVLVSAGGGPVGRRVFDCAVQAADGDSRRWRLLGFHLPDARPSNVTVEPPRPDFRTLLAGAAASVSLCGYNTAMDLLQTGVPAVLVPFDEGGEVEQRLRAEALNRLGGFRVLRTDTLTPEAMREALAAAMGDERRAVVFDFDGARRSMAIAEELVARR